MHLSGGNAMETTNCHSYFSICSNGDIGEGGLQSTESGIFDPDKITELLCIEPFRKWKKGDRRKQVKDENYPSAKYGFSSWSACYQTEPVIDAEEQCVNIVRALKEKIPLLHKIKNEYDVAFNISVVPHIYNEETPILIFNKEVIEFCYLTDTEIEIDLYVFDKE